MDDSGSSFSYVFNNYISVKVAAFQSGCNVQYLRRLLRGGSLSGMKLGQTWLLDKYLFETYFKNAHSTKDRRFGPSSFLPGEVAF